jgi:osmotically-inducible protein OsmY
MSLELAASPTSDRRAEQIGQESFIFETIFGAEHQVSLRALNGVMWLTGSVPDAETRALAGETVAHIPGIDRVENMLAVGAGTPDVDSLAARKIQLHLWSLSQINPGSLRIVVLDGVTTITGSCRDSAQRELVEAGVRLFTGQEVVNEIVVSAGGNYPETPGVIDDVSVTTLSYRALRRIGLGIGQGTVVRTRDGMVMINGSAPSDTVRQQATALVREVRGAQTVVNNLRVRP